MFESMKKYLSVILLCCAGLAVWAQPLRLGVAGVTHDHLWGMLPAIEKGEIDVVGVWEADIRYIGDNLLTPLLPKDRFYGSLEEMLDRTHPEAVVAYGSIKQHLDVVRACAPRGIHIMVEKPLAASVKDASEMAALARRYGILLLTNYETTWYSSNAWVKQRLGELGPLFRIEVYDGHEGPREIGCSERFLEWLTDPVLNGGGAVVDFGCYGANLATWLLDGREPKWVYAILRQNKPAVYPKVDDDALIILDYGDVSVYIGASWCWPKGRKDMFVYGLDGHIYQQTADTVSGWIKGETIPEQSLPALEAPYNNSFRYLEAAVRGEISIGKADTGALENNLTVVKILDAAKRSARTGKRVKLR